MQKSGKVNLIRVVIKALILFILVNLLWVIIAPQVGFLSIYSHIVPGRQRFPFGEVPELAYNFSLDNIDAMFESHEIESGYLNEEYSVFIIGDSSVWGTLLKPEETLAGQLNQLELIHADSGLPVRFYNFGYPTLSLTKDVMVILESLKPYEPDMVLWMVTLESMPWSLQQRSPIVQNNPERLYQLEHWYGLPIKKSGQPIEFDTFWEETLVGQRREIADVLRLQLYGLLWGATGIDQYYPEEYTPAAWDLEADDSYYSLTPETVSEDQFAFEMIQGAIDIASDVLPGVEVVIVNEPILVSQGVNSDIRYNFYYPRWVYDKYRVMMMEQSEKNQWNYFDLWDLVPPSQFTNSAIHLTPEGERILAGAIMDSLKRQEIWEFSE